MYYYGGDGEERGRKADYLTLEKEERKEDVTLRRPGRSRRTDDSSLLGDPGIFYLVAVFRVLMMIDLY